MRTIGFFCFLFLWPLSSVKTTGEINTLDFSSFHFSLQHYTLPAFNPAEKSKATIDTAALKQSGWYKNTITQIEESEYEIKPAGKHLFASPNRRQNLRAFYSPGKFTLEPREDDNWKLELSVMGVYTGNKKIYSPQDNASVTIDKNNIRFSHNNEFTVEYINSKEGVRQNFIIEKEPASKPQTLNIKLQTNKGWFINQVHSKEIHFAKVNGDDIEKKLTYNDLRVWDANNEELCASFSVFNNNVSINVNTADAVYPITIDPLSATPNSILDDCDQANANFGISVASAGDVNGDGYSDVIIGAYSFDDGANTDEGRAFVYHGSATGLSATPNNTPDDGNQANANFGYNVASAGDVNGDGYNDVIIGAYRYDDDFTDEGKAFVYYGSAAGLSATPDNTPDDANQANANFGNSVATAGDVNGDGYSDVIIGAWKYDDGFTDEGKAFVYYGSATGLSATPDNTPDDADQATAYFGYSVASAGDVNGDGYSDVIIGAYFYDDGFTDEGKAFVYYGSGTGLSAIPSNTPDDANQASALFANSVSCAGDVNGDGYSDVIIGAVLYDDGANTNEGRAFVYYGSSTGLSAIPDATPDDADQAGAVFGATVSCAGDVNGDGYSDVIIGASSFDDGVNTNEGRAFVYLGSATGLSATPNETPDDADQAFAQFGISVASAGDVNGDGYSDVIIGANGYDDGPNIDEGWAFIYHGSPDGLSASPVNTPDDANQAGAQFGVSVANAGDVNGDGYSDVIIGAWLYDDGANTNEGRAYLYYGSITGLNASPVSTMDDCDQANAFFGETVAGAGDVNGDGYSDVIIGADSYTDGPFSSEGRTYVYHGSAAGLSASPDWIGDDANQSNANFGVSMTCAGDVNGDGYSDVIVGAIGFQDGANSNEGRAFVYYGSSTGLSASPDWIGDDADQAGVDFGWSVASAGDVNGDGYSDVIIGALFYDDGANTNEGNAFVYHGSATGLSATPNSILDDANQAGALFGECVAPAGDINGDGYGDVIVGAKLFDDGANTDEGRAFVYYGSSTGLNASPGDTPDDANQSNSSFGISVASAGDVNGDGYSDVIIGARFYDDGANTDEGRAFVYYGSSSGLSATPNSTPDDADQAGAYLGYSVACAGDVNGDGFSDVIVGAYLYDDGGNTDEGRALVYYGNNTGGLRNNLRLYNTDLVTPIQQSNIFVPNLFGAGLYAKSPLGRVRGKMVWEVKKESIPFSGSPITNSAAFTGKQSSFSDLGIAGTELKNLVPKVNFQNKVRVRAEYDKTTAITGQVYGPWRYPPGYLQGAHGMNSVPLPVQFISFTALKDGEFSKLRWVTANELPGIRFEVQHSIDGNTFTTLATVNGSNQVNNEYEWLHTSPVKGKNYYRIKAAGQNKTAFTSTRMLSFLSTDKIIIYPDPASPYQNITILNEDFKAGEPADITISNDAGKLVWQKQIVVAERRASIILPGLPPGRYFVLIQAGGTVRKTGFIILKL